MTRLPVVAVVGRPNVGKSSLVNRISGSQKAIVDDVPGITRDRAYYDVDWQGQAFTLVDTGGLDTQTSDEFAGKINDQVMIALEEADVVIWVVDGLTGVTDLDLHLAKPLRAVKKPVLVAVNKIDSHTMVPNASEFYSLGFEQLFPISALHGTLGVGDLLDAVNKAIKDQALSVEVDAPELDESRIRLAFLGRPNVGKSSLINALLGHQRQIVSDVAGTTRDAIDCEFDWGDHRFVLVDTAGMRRRTKVEYGVEYFSVNRSLRAIKQADVTVLVIDAAEGITDQDKKLIEISNKQGNALVLVMNKWDLVPSKQANTMAKEEKAVKNQIPHAAFAPVVFTSALKQQRIDLILTQAVCAAHNHRRRIQTSVVNQLMAEALALSPPPPIKNKRLKVYYASQVAATPPTFVLFVNDDALMKDAYKRYLEKRLREAIELEGTPIIIRLRSKEEQSAQKKPRAKSTKASKKTKVASSKERSR